MVSGGLIFSHEEVKRVVGYLDLQLFFSSYLALHKAFCT